MSRLTLAKIAAVGIGVPPGLLTNQDLEKMVDTSDTWIQERTGIKQRHLVDLDKRGSVATSDLVTIAVKQILDETGMDAKEIELIIVSTITPDMQLPATACIVQHNIGATGAWGFDISIACSGFLYGLLVASQFIATGAHKNVLIAGCDVMSSIIDYTDRQTCILFGDGGGAALLQASEGGDDGHIIDYLFEVDGIGGPFLCLPGGGSRNPTSAETVEKRMHYVHQDGAAVFKFATRKMADICFKLLERNGLTGNDIDLFIPHQANLRIISAAVDRIGTPMEKVVINIGEYGNTTAGTIPLAIRTAIDDGRLTRGKLVLFASMGAGFSAGALLMRW